MDIRSLVADRYAKIDRCYGHCDQPATMKFLNTEGMPVVTGYSCHQAYLSRIIVYSDALTLGGSCELVRSLVGDDQEVKEDDIRLASRYPWDFDFTTGGADKSLMTAYWTQNYRRTKSEDPDRNALFLCESCRNIFQHQLSQRQVLCPGCTSSRPSVP